MIPSFERRQLAHDLKVPACIDRKHQARFLRWQLVHCRSERGESPCLITSVFVLSFGASINILTFILHQRYGARLTNHVIIGHSLLQRHGSRRQRNILHQQQLHRIWFGHHTQRLRLHAPESRSQLPAWSPKSPQHIRIEEAALSYDYPSNDHASI